jgi:hypothetical protein
VGISYFSSVYGLSCDNVISFELVTATGIIITVSKTSYPDLFWALRGGGNNFGLVTQFNVNALPRADTMWGGSRTYLESEWPALLEAYINLGKNANQDGKAHQILSFVSFAGSPPIALVELSTLILSRTQLFWRNTTPLKVRLPIRQLSEVLRNLPH